MAEFKKLGAVEMVETVSDTANVLIEVDGVIKRAPKDGIGSGLPGSTGAGFGFDAVIYNNTVDSRVVLSYGSYNALKTKIDNREAMIVAMVEYNEDNFSFEVLGSIRDNGNYIAIYDSRVEEEYQLYPDNTVLISFIG